MTLFFVGVCWSRVQLRCIEIGEKTSKFQRDSEKSEYFIVHIVNIKVLIIIWNRKYHGQYKKGCPNSQSRAEHSEM